MTDEIDKDAGWRHFIISTPGLMSGKPCIAGTRIPAALIASFIKSGYTIEEVIAEYPGLTCEQIEACVKYQSQSV